MIRARLLAVPSAILCLLSAAWIYYSVRLHVAANIDMRREYQGFEQRLQRTLMMAPQDFRQLLVNTGAATESRDQIVLAGTSQDETFEQMRRRIIKRKRRLQHH